MMDAIQRRNAMASRPVTHPEWRALGGGEISEFQRLTDLIGMLQIDKENKDVADALQNIKYILDEMRLRLPTRRICPEHGTTAHQQQYFHPRQEWLCTVVTGETKRDMYGPISTPLCLKPLIEVTW